MIAQKHNAEMMRDYNLKLLVNLIRTEKTISRAMLARASNMSATTIGRIVGDLIEGGLDEKTRARIDGIGVTLPGVVDSLEGSVLFSPQFHWANVPLKVMLQETFHHNVMI